MTNTVKGFARQANLKGPRPVPLALGRPNAQLKAPVGIIPVEGRFHAGGQLPHQVGVPLPILQGLAAVVEQYIPRSDSDHLHIQTHKHRLWGCEVRQDGHNVSGCWSSQHVHLQCPEGERP